jgi:hypothetical protein
MAAWLCLGLMACATPASSRPAVADAQAPEQVVRDHLSAFNRQDVPALAARVHPDLAWYNVAGDDLEAEVRGRDAFEAAMRGYFAQLPSVRSEVEGLARSGAYVSFRERVRWTSSSGEPRTQTSLAVYEVREGLIRRVWYFPAQQD